MAHNSTYPAGFTKVGGSAPGLSQHDINIKPVGTTSLPMTGNYYTGNTPSDVTRWDVRDATGTVVASGGAIAASVGAFTIPVGIRNTPGWYHVLLYNASDAYMGGGMFILEPAGNPWPTGADYLTAKMGLPCNRMQIGDAADPSVYHPRGWWNGGQAASTAFSPDYTAAHLTDSTWESVDPVRNVNRVNLVNFEGYHYVPPSTGAITYNAADPQQAGVRATAARYAGTGFIYEGTNEPGTQADGALYPSIDANYARVSVAFARAVWDGDSTGRVAVVCPITFNHAFTGRLTAYFNALAGLLTTGEKAKLVISFHDYNIGFDDVLALDEVWDPWVALLESVGLGSNLRVVTEHDGLEAAHYGAGDLTRQLERFSTLNMYAQLHTEREHLFLFYLRQHGHGIYYSWHINEAGQPYPVVAWLLTQERETRQMAVAARHDAGALSRIVLSVRYVNADGAGVVQAKASACPSAAVTYAVTGMTSGSLVKVDWQGRTSTVTVTAGQFTDTLGPLPSFYRLPVGVTAALVPAAPSMYSEVAFISSQPGISPAPSPINATTSKENLTYDTGWAPDTRFAWRGLAPFTPGEWVGADAGTTFTFRGCQIYTPIPRHDVCTILGAALQVKVGGTWVAATKAGVPVTISEATPYQIVASTAQDGVQGWYFGYDPGVHAWRLSCDPTACTAWRLVVSSLTYGESPSLATFRSGAGSGTSGTYAPFVSATSDDHAGFGTEVPYLFVAGLFTEGSAGGGGGGVVPGGPVRYLVRAA